MKKAVVVGGSNGVGLAISKNLIDKGYHVCIIDKSIPDEVAQLEIAQYTFYYCDLLHFNEKLFEELSKDKSVELLMITSGFGKVADFECLHIAEIENLIKVNTIGTIKIIHMFYEQIKSFRPFYCIMYSICR